jgi:hypothetical protein
MASLVHGNGLEHSAKRRVAAGWSLSLGSLPTVPIYDLSIDETHRRIVAATHGRGMWALSAPLVFTEEGWVKMKGDTIGTIWDIPTFGMAFPNTTGAKIPCTVELIQQNGDTCAKGSMDARGGDIFVTPSATGTLGAPGGVLSTSQGSIYDKKPVVWSCLNHKCLGTNPQNNNQPATIEGCNFRWRSGQLDKTTANPVTTVKVVCTGSGTGVANVNGCPALAAPPSNIFTMDPPSGAPSGSFQAVASMQIGSGGTKELCRATVPFAGTDLATDILTRLVGRVNGEPSCSSQGVIALPIGIGPPDTLSAEDTLGEPGVLIGDRGVTASQLFLTVSAPPGQTTGHCFNARALGVPATGALAIMRTSFSTSPGGAKGGSLTVTEASSIGTCKHTIVTNLGDNPVTIATAVEAAFQPTSLPGTVECPVNDNPLDVVREEDSVITVLPSNLTVCSNDNGVGFAMGPEELMLKACTPLPPVYGSNSAQVGDRVVVNRAGGGFGSVASGGTSGVNLGTDTVVGDVVSVGSVTLRDRARVNGLIETGGSVILGNQTTVTGPLLQNVTPNLPILPVLPSSFPPPMGDIDVEPGNTLALAPGSYGHVTIKSRATVNLVSGTYYMLSLDLEPQSTAHLDTRSGPVFIYLHDNLIFRGAFVDPLNNKGNLFIGFTGRRP